MTEKLNYRSKIDVLPDEKETEVYVTINEADGFRRWRGNIKIAGEVTAPALSIMRVNEIGSGALRIELAHNLAAGFSNTIHVHGRLMHPVLSLGTVYLREGETRMVLKEHEVFLGDKLWVAEVDKKRGAISITLVDHAAWLEWIGPAQKVEFLQIVEGQGYPWLGL